MTIALICTRGLMCTHKQGCIHNAPALNLEFITKKVCVFTVRVCRWHTRLEYFEVNLGVGFY